MHKKIRVTFINAKDDSILGYNEINTDNLPATFDVETTLHIGNSEWSVVEAKPSEKAIFEITGELSLKIGKIEKIRADKILFSLPTIAGSLPEISGDSPFRGDGISIHEDDWRQCEFINEKELNDTRSDLIAIKKVWDEFTVNNENYTLFSQCHVRNYKEENLNIDFNQLKKLLETEPEPLQIGGKYILNGFTLKTDKNIYYGLKKNDSVTILCAVDANEDNFNEIQKIIDAFKVNLICWCRCEIH